MTVFKAHQYQNMAIDRILNHKACGLFLEMGLGKTVCALTAIHQLIYDYFSVTKVLVIAPLRVAESVWPDELEKWNHLQGLRMSVVTGSAANRRKALKKQADIYVINRENVPWLVDVSGNNWPFDMVVVDELSSFKSSKSKRFKALRKVRPRIKRIVGLTGTPSPNGLIDLWAQLYLLDRGERLGPTVTGYRERYFTPGWGNGHIVYRWDLKPEAEKRIHEKIGDICVSMKAADWLKMPDRIDNVIKVKLDEESREKYNQLQRDYLLPFTDSDVTADSAAVLSNKLLQLANGAVYDENGDVMPVHEAKLDSLEDIVEAANGKPVLVFYQYKHDLAALKKRFKQAQDVDIKKWNDGKIPLMLAHPASAGHGLNLQAGGNIIVWYGLTWNLEHYQQANARLHRQGQKETVIIHHLVTEKTIDEKVYKALSNKDATQAALMEAVKAEIRGLT